MANPYFDFKNFRVWHDRSSMKVGTDGVLVGAWAPVEHAARILDVGCGCGLVSLMAAQRNREACVVGVDIDEASVRQARENAARSPFGPRIALLTADIRTLTAAPFDCIVSNPPFFDEDLLPPDARRSRARHTQGLALDELLAAARRLLTPQGLFSLILPAQRADTFLPQAAAQGFALVRRTDVVTRSPKPPRRTLLCLSPTPTDGAARRDTLVLTDADGSRSADHFALTRDFYL